MVCSIFYLIYYLFCSRNDGICGLVELVEVEWFRLKIPSVLRMFWVIEILEKTILLLTGMENKNDSWSGTVKYLLIQGCYTFTAVLGLASFIS